MKEINRFVIWIIATSIFLAGICYTFSLFPKYFPFDGFLFAFDLHLLLMAWFAFSITYLKISYEWNYFLPKSIENDGKIYNYFGVNIFRKILVIIGWEKITRKMNGTVKFNIENLKKREKNTRTGEFAHFVIGIIVMILTLILAKSFEDAKWLIITNIIFHFYPVLLQRYNRPRYLKTINKFERRTELKKTMGNTVQN
jgi:hypothetical protein